MNSKLRFGIIGAGYIANVIANAFRLTDDAELVAVASRRRETAEAFARAHNDLRVFDAWADLAAWDGVDAVYVATPTGIRETICVAAAGCGKHVLAEKPFASLPSLQRITAACAAHGVAFMDATHFVHHPRTRQLKREIAARIGAVHAIYTAFFFPSMDRSNIRYDPAKEPTGAIGDMAWYSMRAVAEFTPDDAELVSASGYAQKDEATGAVLRGAGVLLLSNGCTSTWDAGYNVGTCVMDLSLLGERGMISLDDFVLDWAQGFSPNDPGHRVGFVERVGLVTPSGFNRTPAPSPRPQTALMLQDFAALAADPAGAEASASRRASERTQRLLDAVWASLRIC